MTTPSQSNIAVSADQFSDCVPRSASLRPSRVLQSRRMPVPLWPLSAVLPGPHKPVSLSVTVTEAMSMPSKAVSALPALCAMVAVPAAVSASAAALTVTVCAVLQSAVVNISVVGRAVRS